MSIVFSACQKDATSPSPALLAIDGVVELQGIGVVTDVAVNLYAAPQDLELEEVLSAYSTVGFSPIAPCLFDPAAAPPLATVNPNASGEFAFDDLNAGSYSVDALLDGFACAAPRWLILPDNSNAGTISLVQPQPVADVQEDVTWLSGQAYRLLGEVLVHQQATLTIQSGALILADADAALIVAGEIQVQADPGDPARFRLTEEAAAAGADWGGIQLEHPVGGCELVGISVAGTSTALRVIGGQADIRESLFLAPNAFAAYFSAEAQGSISHSIVLDGDQGFVADNCSPTFEYNVLLRTAGAGISIKSNSAGEIYANVIQDCQTGIWSDWDTSPLIHYNLIAGGFRGLDAQNGFAAQVLYNHFTGQSQECIYLHVRDCYPQLENNNFIGAPITILHVNGNAGQQADTVLANYNYWDGEDLSGIPDRIIDGHDIGSPDNPIGPVDFDPFRTIPVPEAGP
jgi:hypothetical protein